jgi:hypothetical protein
LGVPVGFGMTNAIIYHHCATEVGIRCPWSRVDKKYKKDPRFKVELISKKILKMDNKKVQIKMFKNENKKKSLFNSIDYNSLALFREMMAGRYRSHDENE